MKSQKLRVFGTTVMAKLRVIAPYAAMLVLPGGSVMALALWLFRLAKRSSIDYL